MRRTWSGALALLVASCALTSAYARRADLPYEGTWKITVLEGVRELSVWLVRIDKEGKKVEVTGGLPGFDKSKVAGLKADAAAIRFTLQTPRGEYFVIGQAPTEKDKETMLGTVRVGYGFLPARVEKSELTELNQKNAIARVGGYPDLEAALKNADPEDKMKGLQNILKTYENQPIVLVACQALFGELMRKKADANAFKPAAEAYFKTASPYGREMQLAAGKTLGQLLGNYEKTAPLALEYAQKAAKLLQKEDNRGVQITTYIVLAQALNRLGKKENLQAVAGTIKAVADEAVKRPRPGTTEEGVMILIADMLLGSRVPPVVDIGLGYARQALKMLKPDAPVEQRLTALKLLRMGLLLRDRKEEFKTVSAEVEKIEQKLDAEYRKKAIPFVVEKFPGRKGKSDRVVLVELFTGAHCPPCVAADIAFDAALKAYGPKEAVFLQYHVHIPQPDTLANADTLARAKFYDDIESAPTMLVNGETTKPLGGFSKAGKASYDALRELIDKNMEPETEAKIQLEARRTGDKIDVSAKVEALKETGATIKLRLALIEEVVRYPGTNRQRLHHHVVRALLGGNDGFKLENKSSSHKASIDLTALRKQLAGYLAQVERQGARFPNPERPTEMKKLKVVALVQDDITRKIFQAAQVDVPEAGPEKPDGKKEEKPEKKDDR